jgi:hypothetical protein
MENLLPILGALLLIIVLIFTIWVYNKQSKKKMAKIAFDEEQARLQELARIKLFDFYNSILVDIRSANENFQRFLEFETGYFTNNMIQTWNKTNAYLFAKIQGNKYENIQLPKEDVGSIRQFVKYFNSAQNLRNEYNSSFIKHELQIYNSFFVCY